MLRILQNIIKSHVRCNCVHARYVANSAQEKCFIEVSEEQGVREIRLNDPSTLNSLSLSMMESVHNALLQNKNDITLRCIVLSATGNVWSAGHNLKELQSKPELRENTFQKLTDIIMAIKSLPVPVIAKVNGYAAAAGCQLVASCDIIVCSDKSKFSTPGANFGIFCSTPGIAIGRVMSTPKSAYMLMTGLPISGEEAYIAGLATKVVQEQNLDKEVDLITTAIRSKSRAVICFGKEFYYEQMNLTLKEAYERGKNKMCDNMNLADCQEGFKSFIEKRSPEWQHK